jgi:hypothetical protein
MMNCQQAVRLMSDEMDRGLAGSERFSLRLHSLLCVGCRNYQRQISFLRQACRATLAADVTPPTASSPTRE